MQTDSARSRPRNLWGRLRDPGSRLPVSTAFVKFIIVGAAAYVVNQIGLFLLYDALPILPAKDTAVNFAVVTHPDIRLLIASVLAVEAAIVFKFYAHEAWTFPDRLPEGWRITRFLKFNASCILSPVITVATVNVMTPVFGISPYLSNTVGTLLGFWANWVFSAYLIWPSRRPAPVDATPG